MIRVYTDMKNFFPEIPFPDTIGYHTNSPVTDASSLFSSYGPVGGLRSDQTLQANNIDMDACPELDGESDWWRNSMFELHGMKKSSSYQPGRFTFND